jgi:hypothetical protein
LLLVRAAGLRGRLADEMTREPSPGRRTPLGPFLTIGEVGVYALGEDRSRVVWPDGEREVEGFEAASQLAG